jgi:hypothetical protein
MLANMAQSGRCFAARRFLHLLLVGRIWRI